MKNNPELKTWEVFTEIIMSSLLPTSGIKASLKHNIETTIDSVAGRLPSYPST